MELELDLHEFRKAVKAYEKATKKTVPEILNHAATQAAFRGAQARYTPKAKLSGALGTAADPSRSRKRWSKASEPGLDRLYFALAAKNGKPGLDEAMKIYKRRRSSAAFIRVNWNAVINKLGIRRSAKFPRNSDIEFRKATIYKSLVEIYNAKLEGKGQGKAESTLGPGWRRAVNDAVWGKNGMVDYAHKKLKKNWKRR